MIETDILKALQKRVTVAATAAGAVPVKYIGRSFVIPSDDKWIELVHIPNNSLGDYWGNERVYQGIFRIILHWKTDDAGAYAPIEYLNSLSGYFEKGTDLHSGSAIVQIYENPDFTGPLESGPGPIFPLSIRYRCFAA